MSKPMHNTLDLLDERRKPIYTILMLVWPVVLEQLLVTLVQSIDTAMVGSLSASATASVSISMAPMFLINGVMMAFGTGFTVLIARSVGARDYDRSRSLIRQALTTILLLGTPIALLSYRLSYYIPLWMGAEPDVLVLATQYNKIMAIGVLFRGLTMT
ncbi:MAG: MATE family efflux transporter, partial [Clostridia bacterium]|nr:MATE family efflux transporter [Clostridia bacterium]